MAALLAIAAGACSSEGNGAMLHWDLSKTHTLADIERERSGGIDPVDSIRIELPGDRVFAAEGDVNDVVFLAPDADLAEVSIAFEAETAADAYARTQRFIEEWGLTLHPRVDEWWTHAQGVTGPAAAEVDTSQISASAPEAPEGGRLGGPDGPYVSVSILYSFNDDRPFVVQFGIFW
jgi:hypothetical protein